VLTVEEHLGVLFEHLSCVSDSSFARVNTIITITYPRDVQTNTAWTEPLCVHPADTQTHRHVSTHDHVPSRTPPPPQPLQQGLLQSWRTPAGAQDCREAGAVAMTSQWRHSGWYG